MSRRSIAVSVALLAVAGAAAAVAAPAAAHATLDGGGGRSAAGRFTLDASLGGPGGFAQAGGRVLRAGPAGQLNEPPRLRPDTFVQLRLGELIKIHPAALLANDDDPENDPLRLVAVLSPSLIGATLAVVDGWVVYQPAALPLPADEFHYVVDDGAGGRAEAVVSLLAGTADPGVTPNRVGLPVFLPDGSLRVVFAGIPGRTYAIEVTDALGPATWQVLACGPAGANGLLAAVDPASAGGARFYRAIEVAACLP